MKTKVYLFSDNADVSNVVLFDLQTAMEMIANDDHAPNEDYEYTITVAWMTDDEIANLPEANF